MSLFVNQMNSSVKKVTLKNLDGTSAGTISISRPNQKKIKKLNYNFKELSSRILFTKTSGSARQALITARTKVAMLRKKLRTGEYDEEDLQNAIIHAEKMVRAAKKRMKHMQEEELSAYSPDIDSENLEKIKKKHRADEQREILEADMKYLKALFEKMQNEKQNAKQAALQSISGGTFDNMAGSVALELGGVDVPVAESEMSVMAEAGSVDIAL